MSSAVDVSLVFWQLVEAVNSLEYDDLVNTDFFKVMQECVDNKKRFILDIKGTSLLHDDVNALFYNTLVFLQNHGINDLAPILHTAIRKIEDVICRQEVCEKLSSSLSLNDSNTIHMVNNLLAQIKL